MSTTRFSHGVTNIPKVSTLGDMGQLDPTKFNTRFDDFHTFLATDWTTTLVGTGTNALTPGAGGLLLMTTGAALNNSNFIQGTPADFALTIGKGAFFKAKFTLSDPTLSTFQMGLVITDTTPLDATEGVFFQKASGSLDVLGTSALGAGASARVSAVIPGVSKTDMILGFAYNGRDLIRLYVDDRYAASLSVTSATLPASLLNVSFGIQTGAAAAKTMTMDYILAAVER
ncbi:MAG: hypothetical protein COW76_18790 [Shewanella sp. CG18_big_fil_WC_8_21_14_2_50_42_11]|uniref:hypothetical protein n=1 Tax=Shewanella sp. CG18_big_fil_WC_8_21_14_2_50_42_11 TaxID=1975538 RepID=UPI000C60B8E3|nr:hypothetical protein [Shewanella sp. CG18_big_fil_WC_8_21_14_2_50_42_11]PIP98855.1 MAG: hypothetical protein COW76_18790 [Shewanella sp. CG18_big_fil_WC_8_21_14_2_50_42_11]